MSNIRQKVIAMLKTPQLSNLATITLDGKPWTRYVMVQSDDNFNLRTAGCIDSRKVKQIEKNSEVHISFGISDPKNSNEPYVQIQGTATLTTDQQEKNNFWFDMLSVVFEGPEDPKYGVMIIEPYRVEFNNPGSLVPEVWEK